jgi:hypothetical protein
MTDIDEFTEYHAELLDGRYDCMDRIVLNAYFPVAQTGGGLRSWWRLLRGDDADLNDARLRDMAGTFSRRLTAFCTQRQIPLIDTRAGERKHELAEAYLPKEANFQGLFLVMTGNAPAPVWEVRRHETSGHIIEIRHRKQWPYVKHYYFHIMDPQWGHVTVRMCGYPPFGAQVILNGHEWVERQAQQAGYTTVKSGNCFVAGSDLEAVDQVAADLAKATTVERLRGVCDRWIYSMCLIFGLTREEQDRTRFAYRYSVFQLELSRNLLFTRGTMLNEVYQKLLDRTRAPLQLQQVKTIFGFSHRPHRGITRGREGPEVTKTVQAPHYDLTVFKIQWGHLTLKIYDKGARVLRVEVVAHNTKALRCGKVLEKLPFLLERMGGMLVRFLNTVQAAHVGFLDDGSFDQWSEPSARGSRRLAGIDLNKVRNRHVLDAVVSLATKPDGFTVAEVAAQVRNRSGWNEQKYAARHAAYDLARLRGKKLIDRTARSRRFTADPAGIRAMCAYLLLREKVIKPLLAGVIRTRGRPPRTIHPIDQHYIRLREELHNAFETLGLAA